MSRQYPYPVQGSTSLMRFFMCALMLIAGISFAGAEKAAAQSADNFMFILDSSGSMAAKIQGQAKMDIAKKVMADLVSNLPADVHVGLVAYGHRQKKDCNDVEEIAPLGLPVKKKLLDSINALKPLGMTPITHSIEKVAEGLRTVEGETTIVLVSDGEETCGADPCALVRELKASGVRFVMHVIGFDVKAKEKEQLSCIAEAGGGKYYAAKNAQELRLATDKIVEKTQATSGKLVVRAQRNGQPFSALAKLYKPVTGDEKQQQLTDSWTGKEGADFKLSPGVYDLVVENREDAGHPKVSLAGITVEPGKTIEKVVDFSGGTLMVRAQRNGQPFSALAKVYKPVTGDEKQQQLTDSWTRKEGAVFKLIPGVYDLVVENREDAGHPKVSLAEITVEPGKIIEKVVDFSGGTLVVRAQRNGKPFSALAKVYKPAAEGEEKEQVTDSWTNKEGATFRLQPGVYDLVVENREDAGHPKVSLAGITVEPGKPIEKVVDFSGGTLVVKAQRNGKPFSALAKVYKPAAEGEEKEQVTDSWTNKEGATFRLQPGVYDLVVENHEDAGYPKVNVAGITIAPGQPVEKVVDFSGGTLVVKAQRNGQPFSALAKVYKPAAEGEEKEQVTDGWTNKEGATFRLQPGVYDLVVENHEDAGYPKVNVAGITIAPGQPVEKVVDFTGGTLVVRAQRNGQPFSALAKVYRPAAGDEEKEQVTDGWTDQAAATFKLSPGVYDLEVENHKDAGYPKVSIAGIAVQAGMKVEQAVDFSGGTLTIRVQRGGKPFSALAKVFKPAAGDGEKEQLVDGWSDQGSASFSLVPGVYDVLVENQESGENKTFNGITVSAGQTQAIDVQF